MSFLNGAGGAAGAANGAASGLGRLIGTDPSRISSIADRIGTGMNGIAAAGGAAPGYGAPAHPAQQQAGGEPNNYMQLLDPNVMRAIIAKFGGGPSAGYAR